MSQPLYQGIIPPVPTVFDAQGQFDPAGMGRLLDHLIDNGVNGVLVLGSAGEFSHMDRAMREEIAAFTVKYVNGRVPVLFCVSVPGTKETISYAEHAKEVGADAVLIVNPFYAPLSQEALYQHYKQIAAAVDMPQMLYNYPAMTKQELEIGLIKRLALECPNIVGIKDSVVSVTHTREIIVEVKSQRPDFMVFCGFDEHLLNTLALGGDGAIPACSNFAPKILCGLYQAFRAGDYAKAIELHREVGKLASIYGIDTPFYGVIKEAIRQSGVDISTAVLPPSVPISPAGQQKVAEFLARIQ